MKPSVIIWNLETVFDLGGFAAAHDLVGKSDVKVREAPGLLPLGTSAAGGRGFATLRSAKWLKLGSGTMTA